MTDTFPGPGSGTCVWGELYIMVLGSRAGEAGGDTARGEGGEPGEGELGPGVGGAGGGPLSAPSILRFLMPGRAGLMGAGRLAGSG